MPGEQAGSLRERNKARARAEIAAAALRLFTERGFAGVTVDEIVAAAGVSRRTFFRYFDTKEDALLADYPELNTRLTDALAGRGTADLFEMIAAGLHRLADWYITRREAVLERSRLIRDELQLAARNLGFLSQWEKSIAIAVAERTGGDYYDLLPRTAAAAVVAAFRAALSQWVRSSCADDLHRLIDEALDHVRVGLEAAISSARPPA
jgi:AcrR family transcriptional regulator